MKLILSGPHTLRVIHEPSDPRFYGALNAAGESRFLHHLKQKLNALGFDLIKKRMAKDGNLVDDLQQYLRTRNPSTRWPHIALWNDHWAINGIEEDFNRGEAVLRIELDIFGCQPNCEDLLGEILRAQNTEAV